jgi:putative two-component system response regulator
MAKREIKQIPTQKKKTILVIDDVSESLRAIKTVLEDQYMVRLARSGELAKSILTSVPVNLILLDIEMPGVSGFDYMEWLKNNPVTKNIPVMFISSHSEAVVVKAATQYDIKGYIKKPVEPELLKQRINELLSKKE